MSSIQLDGKNQYLASSSNPQKLGIGNNWTLSFWVKAATNPEFTTIFSAGSKEKNRIDVLSTPIPSIGNAHIQARITDADGNVIKHATWGDFFTSATWTHGALTWNGTDLDIYASGTLLVTGTADFVNVTGTMSDELNRKVFYGSALEGRTATASGLVGHLALWNTVLTSAEIQEVAAGTFEIDLTTNSGSYTSSAALKQYWKPGETPSIGESFASSGTQIDISLDANNIDSNNIVLEQP